MKRSQAILLSLLTFACIVSVGLFSRYIPLRFDLSSGGHYLLSPTSKRMVRELSEPVTITWYISDRLKRMDPFPAEILDVLEDYRVASGGNVHIVVEDPASSGNAAAAERLGIKPQTVQFQDDASRYETVYSGILIEYLDRSAVLPFVSSLSTFEYDLSSHIRTLVVQKPRVVGILVASSEKKYDTDFPYLTDALSKAGWQCLEVKALEEFPASLQTLFVFGGERDLTEEGLARIDRFIHGGGRVLFAVDGVFIDTEQSLRASPFENSLLLAMLSFYGVEVRPELALDSACLTLPFETTAASGGTATELVPYPHWPSLLSYFADTRHPVSARFPGLDLFWASPLVLKTGNGLSWMPLFSTTPDSWRMTKNFATQLDAESAFYAEQYSTRGSSTLVAATEGPFPPFFAGSFGQAMTSRVIVVGDGDLATTLISYSKSDRNPEFFVRSADWLSGNEDLIPLRSSVLSNHRLDRITDSSVRRRVVVGVQLLNLLVIPIAILAFTFFMRRRGRK